MDLHGPVRLEDKIAVAGAIADAADRYFGGGKEVLRLKSPAGLSPQNSVSRTKRWRGRSRGVTFAKLSAEERFAVSG